MGNCGYEPKTRGRKVESEGRKGDKTGEVVHKNNCHHVLSSLLSSPCLLRVLYWAGHCDVAGVVLKPSADRTADCS